MGGGWGSFDLRDSPVLLESSSTVCVICGEPLEAINIHLGDGDKWFHVKISQAQGSNLLSFLRKSRTRQPKRAPQIWNLLRPARIVLCANHLVKNKIRWQRTVEIHEFLFSRVDFATLSPYTRLVVWMPLCWTGRL